MTEQEKKDIIIKALYKFHQLELGTSVSTSILNIIQQGEGNESDLAQVLLLGSVLHSEGLIEGSNVGSDYHAKLTLKGIKHAKWLQLESSKFNLYLQVNSGSFNLLDLDRIQAEKVATAYKNGLNSVTIRHTTYYFNNISQISIFTNKFERTSSEIEALAEERYGIDYGRAILSPEDLDDLGDNVTSYFLDDEGYGYQKIIETPSKTTIEYIDSSRIDELKAIKHTKFDLTKLIRICQELNANYQLGNFISVILLTRMIINHVPPLFGNYTTFDQFIGGYGNQSFKKNMKTLNESLRSIADLYNHQLIRNKESLPTIQQVDFKANLDILLTEILFVLHKN